MKDRITSWQSTLPGLALLAFLAVCIWREPKLLDRPEALVALVGGLASVLYKGRASE